MVDSRKIGAYISKLRKEKDLTQVELADKLNISHQAVSKWERGESLPDIMTIPIIANELEVSIDLLMSAGNKQPKPSKQIGKMVEHLSADQTEEVADLINSGATDVKELIDIAPLIKTSQLSKVSEKMNATAWNLDTIVHLAPFLSTEALDEIVIQVTKETIDWKIVHRIAPFLSSSTLHSIANQVISESIEPIELVQLAPF